MTVMFRAPKEKLAVRHGIISLWMATLTVAGCSPERELITRARAIHDSVITIDSHVDIPMNFATAEVDPLTADAQVNLMRMVEGGLDAAFFIVYVGQTERTPENTSQAMADAIVKFDAIHRMTDELYPDQIELAYSSGDVRRIHEARKLVALIGIENGYVIGNDLSTLDRYHALGARYVTLAHNGHNDIADSAQPRPTFGDQAAEHGGVSAFGAQVIDKMNRLGIMVDISHISRSAALQAMRLSRAPVIASHSNVRALAEHVRNLDDETLLALQRNGGVVQTVAFDAYIKVQPPAQREALEALWEALGIGNPGAVRSLSDEDRQRFDDGMAEINARWPPSNVEEFVDHIEYAVELIGIDHVGISSDFGGGGGIIGWSNAAETFNVTLELVRRGYAQEEIEKLWGGNLLRVLREVERVAASPER